MSALDTITAAFLELIPSFNKSSATIESKIIDVVATYADTEAIERNNTVNVINNALATQKNTTKGYYRRVASQFQLGDTLVFDPVNQGAYYDPVNAENQIIKQAYITGSYPLYTLLVNTVDSNGHLRKLTSEELASFITYFDAFQPLGLQLNINSLDPAMIYAPNLLVYVRGGTDAGDAVEKINANLIAYESILRENNTVSLTELGNVIEQYEGVTAVSLGNPYAVETQLDSSVITTYPVDGVFSLVNGAYTFATPVTVDMIKVLE